MGSGEDPCRDFEPGEEERLRMNSWDYDFRTKAHMTPLLHPTHPSQHFSLADMRRLVTNYEGIGMVPWETDGETRYRLYVNENKIKPFQDQVVANIALLPEGSR